MITVMSGKVLEIYVAERSAKPDQRHEVDVKASQGIVGDRYFDGNGTFSKKLEGNRKSEITFIASEEIDRFNEGQGESLTYGELRRNIITQGVNLEELIGKEFSIGTAKFLGIERCEPCAHLATTVNSKVLPHLSNTGLRAAILESGKCHVDDAITISYQC
jgi:MOSC domain-containing protein YiiM